MKRNALVKDFFREIRGSLNRFLSILCIVALGVAFYTGIRSSQPDMQASADALYDQINLMDVRVLGELGMTQQDVDALADIEGVTQAQGGYTAYALSERGGAQSVVSVISLCGDMNQVTLTQGRLPEAPDECFLDEGYMKSAGIALGDTIALRSGKEDDDLSDTLAEDVFTVVGAGSYAWYLNLDRGTADIGNGDVKFFICVPPESFSMEVYTVAYLACDGADGLNCYGDEYEDYIDGVKDRIEAIAGERCDIRYQEVQAEGAEKIADARQEIADGEAELADAEQQLADAEVKLSDAAEEIADGEQEIADGEAELADAKSELNRQQKKIDEGWEELNAAKEELGLAAQEIDDARSELNSGAAQASNSRRQLDEQSAQFNAYAAQAETLKSAEGYAQAQANYAALQAAQGAGLPLTDEQTSALQFYGQILPQVDGALQGAPATDETLTAVIDGALQPTRDAIADGYAQLSAADRQIESGREQLADAQAEYDDALRQIQESEQQLLDGQAEIDKGWAEVRKAEKELEEGRQELADGRKEYEDALAEYEDAKQEFDEKSADAQRDIDEAKQKVADAEQELADLEQPEWYVLDRQSIQSYVEFGLDAERIGALGKVFPAIFFLVAALVALTTMTRMVEEGRLQVGTMKALGYSKAAIAGKYIGYALLAALLGGLVGIPVGSTLFPYVIMTAYHMLYANLTVMLMPVQWGLSLSALAIAVVCVVGATLMACYAQLSATPAQLMRPTAPPEGKRVALEYIPALWRRMSFTAKATFRNLFRYKKRLFMTLFGIGACMGLLLVGFGLRDSIAEIVNKQYSAVWTYDVSVSVDSNELEQLPQVEDAIAQLTEVDAQLSAKVTVIDARANGVTKSVNLFVPEKPENLGKTVSLQTRREQQPIELTEEGVVLTEKAARLLEVSVGDEIELMEDETQSVRATVTGIAENYLYHYVYITPGLYETLYGEKPEYDTVFLCTNTGLEEQDALGKALLRIPHVTGVSFVSDLEETVANMMHSLDLVVWVLVAAAALLAFVVLYNLNNIAIIERRRELATLKVLGFHDGEVAMYVYRENIWLTGIGILLGMVIGVILHQFVIRTCEVDMIMFGQEIGALSYLYSAVLTGVFAVIVNFFMYFSLKKIDMVESLKSVE